MSLTIKEARNALGMTNVELADRLGVAVKTVENYISGRGGKSIDRASIAVRRNYTKLTKEATKCITKSNS